VPLWVAFEEVLRHWIPPLQYLCQVSYEEEDTCVI
jgi:hypothetical protein